MQAKLYFLLSLMMVLVVITGCEDFLVEEQAELISEDILYTSEENSLPAVLGMYEGLAGENMPSGGNYYSVLTNDLMHINNASYRTLQYTANDNEGYINGIYSDHYAIIGRANEILDALEDATFSEASEYMAEAKFVRAYLYFDLVRLFGGVPLVTEKPEDYFVDNVLNTRRSSETVVYRQVVEDLEDAIIGLPETAGSGRPSADAARAMLARVQLYRASIQQRDETGDGLDLYQEVVNLCDTIIQAGRYELAEFYQAIFHPRFEGIANSEVLFKLNQRFGDGLADDDFNILSIDTDGGIYGGSSFGNYRITYKAFTNFSRGDSARRMTNFLRAEYGVQYNWVLGGSGEFQSIEYQRYLPDVEDYRNSDGTIDFDAIVNSYEDGIGDFQWTDRVTPNKYSNYPLGDPNADNTGTDVDIPVIRMGEVYLMMAEALNEVNRNPSVAGPSGLNAFDYVNAVRRRACVTYNDGGDYVANNGTTWSEVAGAVPDWSSGYFGEDWHGNDLYTSRVQSAIDDNNFVYWTYGSDYAAFRNEIIWERARELFMEQGTRFHDMVRRGSTAVDEIFMVDNLPGIYTSGRYSIGSWDAEFGIEQFTTVNNFKLPIPLEQLNNNAALIQNDGY